MQAALPAESATPPLLMSCLPHWSERWQFLAEEIHSMIPDKEAPEKERTEPEELNDAGYTVVMELASALELTNPLKIEELLPQVEPLLTSADFAELDALVMDYEYEKAHSYLLQCPQVAERT